jgi:hypothetical protein
MRPIDILSDARLDHIFPLVLKYSMRSIEENILERLKAPSSLEDAVKLTRWASLNSRF